VNRKEIVERAREQSAKTVEQLRAQNAAKPEGKYVTDEDYDRFRRLLERKIVRYS
jgi:hypothetical protein